MKSRAQDRFALFGFETAVSGGTEEGCLGMRFHATIQSAIAELSTAVGGTTWAGEGGLGC